MWGARTTGSPMTSTSGTSRGTSVLIRFDERREPGRLQGRLGRHGTQRGGRRDDAPARSRNRVPGGSRARPRGAASASGCPCGSPARRPRQGRPTCARSRSAPTSPPGNGSRPAVCAASTSSGTPRLGGRPRPPRRSAGPCRPRGWRSAGRPGPYRSARTAFRKAVRSTAPVRSDADRLDRTAVALVDPGGVQHAGVLHRAGHQMPAGPAPSVQGAEHAQMDGLGAGGGERRPRRDGRRAPRRPLSWPVRAASVPGGPEPYSLAGSAQPTSSAAIRASRA